jgi:hypothetical protein
MFGDLTLHWVSVGPVNPRHVILYLHGGAYFVGSGTAYRGLLGRISKMTGLGYVPLITGYCKMRHSRLRLMTLSQRGMHSLPKGIVQKILFWVETAQGAG